ncbi:MAG: sulfite oxidase heme-binding subunit YedZ [Gemmatimonadaceae bacterium]
MSAITRLKPVVFVCCLAPAALLAWNLWGVTHDRPEALGANPIREAEIFTGLWALRFLAMTLAVTPVRELLGIGALAKYRRMFGLFTFFYACIHLSMWVGVDWFFDWRAMGGEIVKHKYILIGMTTFVLLLPLALTSTNASVRRLGGAQWSRLHRLVYVCAITGTVHYLWAVKKDTLFPLIYLVVFAALLGFRLWEQYVGPIRLRSRRPRRAMPRPDPTLPGAATSNARPVVETK